MYYVMRASAPSLHRESLIYNIYMFFLSLIIIIIATHEKVHMYYTT